MATADKLQKILETKTAIRNAIVSKGVEVPDDTVFADYPSKINAIEVSGKTNPYEELFNIKTNGGNYSYLLSYCNAESLDVSMLDTSNATDMNHMFYYCDKLTELDVSNFNTSKVKDMSYMFNQCNKLTSLDVSNFNTSNVTNMTHMFGFCPILALLEGLSNFDTRNVTNMSYMFYSCNKLETLDLSNFDTSNATNITSMFYNCTNLTSIDVSNWDTSKVTNISSVFQNCDKLTSLDVSSWDIGKVTASYAISNPFDCPALTDFKAPKNINAAINFSKCTKLTHDSLMSIINNLTTKTSTTKLTLGATNLAKLTDEEIAIATNKGWTLA